MPAGPPGTTLLRCAGQLRIAPNGWIVELDLAAAIAVGTALGHRDGTSGGRRRGPYLR
jgi:hypothetical protein